MEYKIRVFRGFGSRDRIYINGQVARGRADKRQHHAGDWKSRLWGRIRYALKLAVSRRLPGCRLRISCAGTVTETHSDSHGHFSVSLRVTDQEVHTPWQSYRVELLEPTGPEPVAAEGVVLIAGEKAKRIVVSDIDDTIIYTGVANKAMMLWRLFAHSARKKIPFPGIDAFFRGLHGGADGREANPLIYVSRSPWSIYPVLEEFFEMHQFPSGPVLQLREWGVTWRHPWPRRARSHKARLLTRISEMYPAHRFLLIGDSGQRDPELYRDFASHHPGRIDAVYLRDVGSNERRTRELAKIADTLAELEVPVVITGDTSQMAQDALGRDFIQRSDLIASREDAASQVK